MLYCLPQVFVEPGQSVEEGETLIIMEAMKMEVEYSLCGVLLFLSYLASWLFLTIPKAQQNSI